MYAPDGSNVSGTLIGEGMDSGDKASNKAMSIAMKYFCFQTFMIPTEEMKDPDAEVHDNVLPRQDAPATVTKVSEVKVTPNEYIRASIADIQKKMKIRTYEDARKLVVGWVGTLVQSGVIEQVNWNTVSLDEAINLFNAINANFNPGGGK